MAMPPGMPLSHLRALQLALYTEGNAETVPLCNLFPGVPRSEIHAGDDRHTRSHCRQQQDGQSHTNTNESADIWLC